MEKELKQELINYIKKYIDNNNNEIDCYNNIIDMMCNWYSYSYDNKIELKSYLDNVNNND